MSSIKLELPSNDAVVLNAFGDALHQIAREILGDVAPSLRKTHVAALASEIVTAPPANAPETVTPPAPPSATPVTAFTETYMYSLEQDLFFIAKSQSDVDEHLDKGFVISSEEDFKAWTDDNNTSDPAAANFGDSEFDTDGIVWDERIHSDTKSKNADGTWRVRRKPKDTEKSEWETYVNTVKAELSGAAGSVTDAPETVTPPAPPADAPETVTPPAPPADAPETVTFAALMKLITGNGVKLDVVKEVLAKNDVPALPLLNSSASEKLAAVYAGIKSIVEG